MLLPDIHELRAAHHLHRLKTCTSGRHRSASRRHPRHQARDPISIGGELCPKACLEVGLLERAQHPVPEQRSCERVEHHEPRAEHQADAHPATAIEGADQTPSALAATSTTSPTSGTHDGGGAAGRGAAVRGDCGDCGDCGAAGARLPSLGERADFSGEYHPNCRGPAPEASVMISLWHLKTYC